MSNKIALPLFITTMILASVAVMTIPQASALNNSGYDNSHVTARFYGHMRVCGNHICAPSERTEWEKAVWDRQSQSQGKITSPQQHGEDIMNQMAGSAQKPTTAHGSEKPTIHSTMPVINATKSMNMTGGKPNNK